jgi:hypothetical protein
MYPHSFVLPNAPSSLQFLQHNLDRVGSWMHVNFISERGTEAQSCSEAMDQLRKAATDLSELTRQMDDFADWWQEMDVSVIGYCNFEPF